MWHNTAYQKIMTGCIRMKNSIPVGTETVYCTNLEFTDLFHNTPRRTTLMHHDADMEDVHPIKWHPYRVKVKPEP